MRKHAGSTPASGTGRLARVRCSLDQLQLIYGVEGAYPTLKSGKLRLPSGDSHELNGVVAVESRVACVRVKLNEQHAIILARSSIGRTLGSQPGKAGSTPARVTRVAMRIETVT